MAFGRCALFLVLMSSASSSRESQGMAVNPIRRVVTMLQMMGKKIAAEGEKEEEQFDRFMCYCKTGGASLEKAIADAEVKIPQLESALKESGSQVVQLKADVKAHKADRDSAKAAMKEATALREKEAGVFADYSAEATANIKAMTGAIAALEKGMGGAFLQTVAKALLQKVVASADLEDSDREAVTAFLSQSQGYAPQSGQITGILKQMKDTWSAELADATKVEEKSIADYDGLMKAKAKEVEALQKMIEEKTARIGEMGVEVVNMADDLEDTKKSLAEDKAFLADLAKNCETKKSEWAVREKLRAEEQLALADTIKILNSDDALELFKQTLPTPALLQVKVSEKALRSQAQELLQGHRDARLDLISLALKGRKVSFDKVIKMIDDMVVLLAEEQKADDDKSTYCAKEFDETDDTKKSLARAISDLDTGIADTKSAIATLTDELAALAKGIVDLDKQVVEATEARKEAHASYVEETASNSAALELLEIAKNRLNKFYNPKLYKAAPKRELTREERISVNNGGTMAPTAPPGGISGTGVTAFAQERPGPAPEMYGDYKKSSEESTGVIGMIDILKADLSKEMQESKVDEQHDQEEYEQMSSDAAEKRAADSKSIQEKEGAKADAEALLISSEAEHKSKTAEAMANDKVIHDLHQECDWLISNFDVRKEARAGEVESLKTAKAVLSGADYSLLQSNRGAAQLRR